MSACSRCLAPESDCDCHDKVALRAANTVLRDSLQRQSDGAARAEADNAALRAGLEAIEATSGSALAMASASDERRDLKADVLRLLAERDEYAMRIAERSNRETMDRFVRAEHTYGSARLIDLCLTQADLAALVSEVP